MELFLSKNSTTNTVVEDEFGEARYKIETPFKFIGRVTTIRKAIRSDRKSDPFSSSGSDLLDDSSVQSNSLVKERLMDFAEIRWRVFASSSMRFGAIEVDMSDYMPAQGFCRR
jgi:hypothetical protein